MAYTVLARRYRSKTFEEVIGQEPIAQTLRSAIEHDRVAHAYLFCGTRGVGKTTMARILARALNCEKGPTPQPCGKCDICEAIHRGDDMDVLEIDGASNNLVEDVRVLRDNAHYRPARSRFKIYYIDEVHMLSRNAFNALLKTLEEPPEHVKFIFSTTEPERLPATVLSRCQRFDFRAVPTDLIAGHLKMICKKEKVKPQAEAMLAIAREGRGSVRDAITLLDQVIAVGDGVVTLDAVRETVGAVAGEDVLALIGACADGDAGGALTRFGNLLAGGIDIRSLLEQLMRQVRDLLVVKTCGSEAELLDPFGPDRERLTEVAEKLAVPALVACLGYLGEARTRARWVVDARPIAELALVRMASLSEMEPLPEVVARLESLEASLAGAAPVATGDPGTGTARGRATAGSPCQGAVAGSTGRAATSAQPAPAPPEPAAPSEKKKQPPAVGGPPGDEVAAEAEKPPPSDGRPNLDDAMTDPVVRKAVDIFEGRIIEPRPRP